MRRGVGAAADATNHVIWVMPTRVCVWTMERESAVCRERDDITHEAMMERCDES